MTKPENFTLNRFLLRFINHEIEKSYRIVVLERTVVYCRVAWILFVLATVSFGFLDQTSFGLHAHVVHLWRWGMVSAAAVVIGATYSKNLRWILRFSAPLFILVPGLFSTYVVGISGDSHFSPYFISFSFAFAGIFTTPGLGFAFAIPAMLATLFIFNGAFLLGWPIPSSLMLIYNFFMVGLITVFTAAGYLVERTTRHDFVVSSKLKESLEQVKTLRGLLPICSACKKIRDDKGYWNQIETYVSAHTDASFSHGICPECAVELYPELGNLLQPESNENAK